MSEFETSAQQWLARRAYRPGQPMGFGLKDILSHIAAHISSGTQDRAGLIAVLRTATPAELDRLRQLHPHAGAMVNELLQEAI